ncbi:MAG TPA: type II secretion system protein GspM [Paucimonas sp.]|nr:type II secretion system protein GspM [Paucimonas sp.]
MNGVNDIKANISAFWLERNARERNMLAAGAAAVILALLYLLFINPALSGRAQLQKSLPQLRQQAAEMQMLARQATELNAAATTPAAPVTKDDIESSLARRSLKPQSVLVSGELVKLSLQSVSFAAVASWLDEMQKTSRLALTEGTIEAQSGIDTVNATLTLRQQRSTE